MIVVLKEGSRGKNGSVYLATPMGCQHAEGVALTSPLLSLQLRSSLTLDMMKGCLSSQPFVIVLRTASGCRTNSHFVILQQLLFLSIYKYCLPRNICEIIEVLLELHNTDTRLCWKITGQCYLVSTVAETPVSLLLLLCL